MLYDPSTPDHRPPVAPFQQKIHRVALPICIPQPDSCFRHLDGSEQMCTEVLGISGCHAQGCSEKRRFVLPFVMQGIEAIVA